MEELAAVAAAVILAVAAVLDMDSLQTKKVQVAVDQAMLNLAY
jgi:hypothetical protein